MSRPRILTIGPRGGPLERLEEELERRRLQIEHVHLAGAAFKLIRSRRPVLIVVSFPPADMSAHDFFTELDRRIEPLKSTKVLLLADEHHRERIQRYLDERHTLLSPTWSPEVLHTFIRGLLPVEMRAAKRLMLRLEVELEAGSQVRMCQSDNISETGMLVRTSQSLPVGTELRVAISLPSQADPIHARAEIARHTHPERENVRGLGLRFLEIEGNGKKALEDYLASQDDSTDRIQTGGRG